MSQIPPTAEHSVVTTENAEAVWFTGCLALIKASTESTGGILGLVEFTHPPGFATPPHLHRNEDEAFYVLEGSMTGFCGDSTWQATTGDFVWLPRAIPHGYTVDEGATLRTLAITVPTGFERFVREAGAPAESRTLPPPSEPDLGKLQRAADKYGQEFIHP